MFLEKILKYFFAGPEILNGLLLIDLNRFAVTDNISCKDYRNLSFNYRLRKAQTVIINSTHIRIGVLSSMRRK